MMDFSGAFIVKTTVAGFSNNWVTIMKLDATVGTFLIRVTDYLCSRCVCG